MSFSNEPFFILAWLETALQHHRTSQSLVKKQKNKTKPTQKRFYYYYLLPTDQADSVNVGEPWITALQ